MAAEKPVEKPFVRVTDGETGHEFDIHRDSLARDKGRYTPVKDVTDSWTARPAKPAEPKTSRAKASETANS